MKYKYGNFEYKQIGKYKEILHKKLFWMLLYKDPKTESQFNIDFDKYFVNIMKEIDGFNSLLFYPTEIVRILSILESAFLETKKDIFDYESYRKLILDAHNLIDKIGG